MRSFDFCYDMAQSSGDKMFSVEVGKIVYNEKCHDLKMLKVATLKQNLCGQDTARAAAKACMKNSAGVVVVSDTLEGMCNFMAEIRGLKKEEEKAKQAAEHIRKESH